MFNNLFGPKELILYVQQWLSQNLMDSSKVLREVYLNRYFEENGAKIFCHRENLFFEMFVSINLLGPKKWSFAQYLSENNVKQHKLLHDVCHLRL